MIPALGCMVRCPRLRGPIPASSQQFRIAKYSLACSWKKEEVSNDERAAPVVLFFSKVKTNTQLAAFGNDDFLTLDAAVFMPCF